jgi:hypothetical protein
MSKTFTNLKSIHIKTQVRKWVAPKRLWYIFWQSEETSYQHENTLLTTQPGKGAMRE